MEPFIAVWYDADNSKWIVSKETYKDSKTLKDFPSKSEAVEFASKKGIESRIDVEVLD